MGKAYSGDMEKDSASIKQSVYEPGLNTVRGYRGIGRVC